jgi:hypothetical protein
MDRGELRTARASWRALPRTRRRALEVRAATPRTTEEADAMVGRGRYLRSWAGALEWFVAGAVGVGLAVALQYGLAGSLPWDPLQLLVFIVGFGGVGVALRRWRGRQLIDRGSTALAPQPDAGDHPGRGDSAGPGPTDGPAGEFGTPGPDG